MEEESHASDTLGLRCAAIGVIFGAACLGTLIPILVRGGTQGKAVTLIRAFSAGVILALAQVHVYPDAAESLGIVVEDYPVAGAASMFGFLAMLFIEQFMNAVTPHSHSHGDVEDAGAGDSDMHRDSLRSQLAAVSAMRHASAANMLQLHPAATAKQEAQTPTQTSLRQTVLAYIMELACVFHSLIIGFGLGVIVHGRGTVIALLVALSVHQFLEGLSLGIVIRSAGFSRVKSLAMVSMYSLTTPIGVAVGIAVSKGYKPESVRANAIQGSLLAVGSGMLVYVAAVQLISEEFAKTALSGGKGMKFALPCATFLGAALMCVIALWA